MNKIAFFDFCETIANFQTADAFIDYVRSKEKRRSVYFYYKLYTLFRTFRIIQLLSIIFPKKSINKKMYALQLRGIQLKELELLAERYYYEKVRPNLIVATINELINLRNNNVRIVLVSGGYDLYLKHFAKEYGILESDIISTSFKISNGRCTGLFNGNDCLYEEKVKRLNEHYKEYKCCSIAFSDSKSDLPMLEWANEAIVVRERNKNKWNNNFKELVWEK